MLCKLYINCNICDVRFTQSESLNGHISAAHEIHKYGSRYGTGICEKAVIAMENQTYFGENLQFSLKTEGFLNHKSYGKASVFF